jgi:hypothetical protein
LFTCNEQGQLLSRSSIVILSAVLVGMGIGNSLHGEVATLCGFAGLIGVAAFFSLHLVAHRRHSDKINTAVERVNERLASTRIATEAIASADCSNGGSLATAAHVINHDSAGL